MTSDYIIPKEGDLFMVVTAHGHTFELRYGYYEEADRAVCEPVVVYPDFITVPVYTEEGYPLVTAVQPPCECYRVSDGRTPEECCSDCIYYPDMRVEIGACRCERRRMASA